MGQRLADIRLVAGMMSQAPTEDQRRRSRKPDVRTAMQALIAQLRQRIPFDGDDSRICAGDCQGCSMKLIELLDAELTDWEHRLARGGDPGLKDLSLLAKTAQKICRVLERNGVLTPLPPQDGRPPPG